MTRLTAETEWMLARRTQTAVLSSEVMLRAAAGDYVRIKQVVLRPEERAPNIPAETRATPLQMWVNGHLMSGAASVGETVTIETAIGRRLEGELVEIDPRYAHDFGDPQPELLEAGRRMVERLL